MNLGPKKDVCCLLSPNRWSWKLTNSVLEKFLKEQLAHQQNANTKKKTKKQNRCRLEVKWHPKIDQHISRMQRKQTKHKQRQTKTKQKK